MLLWILLASAVGGALSDCPNSEFIGPACSCKTVLFGTHVVCSDVNGTRALRDVFNVLVNYEVATLLFRGLRISGPLPSDAFRGMKVKKLNLVDSVFNFSSQAAPLAGLESRLVQLDLMNCNVGGPGGLTALDFSHLSRLTEFNAQFVQLGTLPGHWFARALPRVLRLRLDHDEIDRVEEGALAGLGGLVKLSLADNRLEGLTRGSLPRPAGHLEWLDLSYNRLETLPENFFGQMPRLKRVVLSGNRFRSLPQSTWQGVWTRLEHLLLKDNPVECDGRIKWLLERKAPDHLEATCHRPETLSGSELSALTPEQLPDAD